MLSRIAYRIIAFFALVPFACCPAMPGAQELRLVSKTSPAGAVQWRTTEARQAYGLPDCKSNKKGTLTLGASQLTFTTKSSSISIQRASILSVSAGSDRVELWGTGGMILRLAIPEGGGLAAAAVMQHRVGMLTVEFTDTRGGVHFAVFDLPAAEADHALAAFAKDPVQPRHRTEGGCGSNPMEPRSVLVGIPNWDKADVPAAYRGLIYEHVIHRLETMKAVGHVYRYGEVGPETACPEYTIGIAIEVYRKGSQVARAATGPVGMFTSATQMTFEVTYVDESTGLRKQEEIKASVRTQSESTGVADAVAKKLAKQFGAMMRTSAAPVTGATAGHPAGS